MKVILSILISLISLIVLNACRTSTRVPTSPQATPDTRTAASEVNQRISLNLPIQKNRQPTSQPSFTSQPQTPSIDSNQRVSINLPKQTKPDIQPSAQPTTIKRTQLDFNKTISGEWFDMTFTGIEFSNSLESKNSQAPAPKLNHIFMFFKATITNTSEKARSFNLSNYTPQLLHKNGEIQLFPSYLYRDDFLNDSLASGESLQGSFVFEVNQTLNNLTLTINDFKSEETISIEVDGPGKHR